MFEAMRRAVEHLQQLVAEFEPDRFDGAGARSLVELFGEVERLGAAGKALATRQVVATGAWKHDGAHRDPATWLAEATGSTVGAARATVSAAERLSVLPATEAALRAGALSAVQVEAITDAASVDPAAEQDLLDCAHHDGVRGLRNVCAQVKAAASVDDDARYERIYQARSVRSWTDPDGTGRIDVRGPVDLTTRVLTAIAPYERELFDAARADGRLIRSDALVFDALVAFADAPAGERTTGARRETTTVVRIDHAALLRGTTESGEVCEIVGSGPIPVSVAQRMLEDSFVKAVLVDGIDVLAVSHLGRMIPARLRTAVEEVHPECDVESCHVTWNLEIDHNKPVEEHGPTALWNLDRLCLQHHQHKHRLGLRLLGPPGRMRFVSPPEWVARC